MWLAVDQTDDAAKQAFFDEYYVDQAFIDASVIRLGDLEGARDTLVDDIT